MNYPRITGAPEAIFLTAADVPPNLLRLKPGEKLRWKGTPRRVVRVGYRKTARDFITQADELLDTNEGRTAEYALASLRTAILLNASLLTGTDVADALIRPPLRLRGLAWVVARALAADANLGGPDRGVFVETSFGVHPEMIVQSTRTVRLGHYYPPDGDDGVPGGLDRPRTVVLVSLVGGLFEALSGDLERA